MSSDSTLYTIGTALNRAKDNDIPVQILVEGSWISGTVTAVDGFGVVLSSDELEHAVIRVEAVSAVKIATVAPHRTPIQAAHPMPGPRAAAFA
jgi:sRNA-binding regulator protein Hfq